MNEYDAELNNKIYRSALAAGLDPAAHGIEYVIDSQIEREFEHYGEIAAPARIERALVRAERDRAVARWQEENERQRTLFAVIGSSLVVSWMAVGASLGLAEVMFLFIGACAIGKAIFVR
jgi:hypothetical protein